MDLEKRKVCFCWFSLCVIFAIFGEFFREVFKDLKVSASHEDRLLDVSVMDPHAIRRFVKFLWCLWALAVHLFCFGKNEVTFKVN